MLKLLVSWLRWRARRSRKSTFLAPGVRTIVAVELTRLGDFVTVLPVLRALRKSFPAAQFHVVTAHAHAPLLSLIEPGIGIISVRGGNSLSGFFGALRQVRRLKPDLVCSMGPANRNAALALASAAPFIVGYLNGTDSLTPFLGVTPVESIGFTGRGGVTFTSENIQDRPWKVLHSLGLNAPRDPLASFARSKPPDTEHARCRPPGLSERSVVLHPFSGWEFRSWPLVQYGALAERLLAELPHDIVFLCHAGESGRLESLRRSFGGNSRVHFVPSSEIMESAALIGLAELFIGNDSGPLHLAALLGVPVVGLFGPAPPKRTAPYASPGVFLYHSVPCSPCSQTRCTMPDNPCMHRITVNEVFQAASGLLAQGRADSVAAHG